MFNPKPLEHKFWPGLMKVDTGLIGATIGFVAAFIHRMYRPKARWLIIGLLIVAVAFCFLGFERGDPNDMDDLAFMLD